MKKMCRSLGVSFLAVALAWAILSPETAWAG
jgi:hypothetical protein